MVLAGQEGFELAQYFVDCGGLEVADELRFSRPPIEAAHLIREYCPADSSFFGENDFEGVSFDLARDRTKYREPRSPIVFQG